MMKCYFSKILGLSIALTLTACTQPKIQTSHSEPVKTTPLEKPVPSQFFNPPNYPKDAIFNSVGYEGYLKIENGCIFIQEKDSQVIAVPIFRSDMYQLSDDEQAILFEDKVFRTNDLISTGVIIKNEHEVKQYNPNNCKGDVYFVVIEHTKIKK